MLIINQAAVFIPYNTGGRIVVRSNLLSVRILEVHAHQVTRIRQVLAKQPDLMDACATETNLS